MEEVKKFLKDKGLGVEDVPKGLVVHEVIGVGILLSAWGFCHMFKPSSKLVNVLKARNIGQWERAKKRVETSRLMNYARKNFSAQQTARLGVSFAESFVLRKALVPVLVPLKLWLSYQIVLQTKSCTTKQ